MSDWVDDCMQWRGKVLDGPRAHWCFDWDDLPIDDTCPEAACCGCYERTAEERITIESLIEPISVEAAFSW